MTEETYWTVRFTLKAGGRVERLAGFSYLVSSTFVWEVGLAAEGSRDRTYRSGHSESSRFALPGNLRAQVAHAKHIWSIRIPKDL
jgi:hypothetical protein